MKRVFFAVFLVVYAIGALIAVAVQPDFSPAQSQTLVPSSLWHVAESRSADKFVRRITAKVPPGAAMRVLVPAHTGGVAVAIDGRALQQLPDRPHTAITRYHRMSEFAVPPGVVGSGPVALTITRSGPMRHVAMPETIIGPEATIIRLAAAQQSLVTLVDRATMITMTVGVLMSLLLLFVSRRIAHYAYLLLMFGLLLALEFREQINLLGHPLLDFIHYFGLTYLLLSALSFSHWTAGPPRERTTAFRIFCGAMVLCVLLDMAFGVTSNASVQIKMLAFVIPSLMMLAWVSLRLIRRVREFDLASTLIFTFVAAFASAFGVALLTIWYAPISAGGRLWLLCLTNSVEATAFCGMLLSAAAIEIKRYRAVLSHHRRLDSIASGTILALDGETVRLKGEIEDHAISAERRRFTQGIHDGIGGQLLSLLIKARTGRIDADELEKEIGHCIADLRLITAALDADNDRLSDGLAAFAGRAEDQLALADMQLDWDVRGNIDALTLPSGVTLDVLRIAQELLTNAIRHANADRVQICFNAEADEGSPAPDRLRIDVSDTGRSFDSSRTLRPGRGIANMQARVRRLGGAMVIGRSASGGAAISLSIPVSASRATVSLPDNAPLRQPALAESLRAR